MEGTERVVESDVDAAGPGIERDGDALGRRQGEQESVIPGST